MFRRELLTGAVSMIFVTACRSTGNASAEDEPIGPLLAPDVLAARMEDVKSGKIAVLYVGPDVLFGRGHVPGARKLAPVDSEAGRRALADALARIPTEPKSSSTAGAARSRTAPTSDRPAPRSARSTARTRTC